MPTKLFPCTSFYSFRPKVATIDLLAPFHGWSKKGWPFQKVLQLGFHCYQTRAEEGNFQVTLPDGFKQLSKRPNTVCAEALLVPILDRARTIHFFRLLTHRINWWTHQVQFWVLASCASELLVGDPGQKGQIQFWCVFIDGVFMLIQHAEKCSCKNSIWFPGLTNHALISHAFLSSASFPAVFTSLHWMSPGGHTGSRTLSKMQFSWFCRSTGCVDVSWGAPNFWASGNSFIQLAPRHQQRHSHKAKQSSNHRMLSWPLEFSSPSYGILGCRYPKDSWHKFFQKEKGTRGTKTVALLLCYQKWHCTINDVSELSCRYCSRPSTFFSSLLRDHPLHAKETQYWQKRELSFFLRTRSIPQKCCSFENAARGYNKKIMSIWQHFHPMCCFNLSSETERRRQKAAILANFEPGSSVKHIWGRYEISRKMIHIPLSCSTKQQSKTEKRQKKVVIETLHWVMIQLNTKESNCHLSDISQEVPSVPSNQCRLCFSEPWEEKNFIQMCIRRKVGWSTANVVWQMFWTKECLGKCQTKRAIWDWVKKQNKNKTNKQKNQQKKKTKQKKKIQIKQKLSASSGEIRRHRGPWSQVAVVYTISGAKRFCGQRILGLVLRTAGHTVTFSNRIVLSVVLWMCRTSLSWLNTTRFTLLTWCSHNR